MKSLLMFAVMLSLAPAASAEDAAEQAAPPVQAEGQNDGTNLRNMHTRFQKMSPEDKKKFLAEHPNFRERVGNALEHKGEKLERRGERLENKGERLEQQGERMQERAGKLEARAAELKAEGKEKAAARVERCADKLENAGERRGHRGERMSAAASAWSVAASGWAASASSTGARPPGRPVETQIEAGRVAFNRRAPAIVVVKLFSGMPSSTSMTPAHGEQSPASSPKSIVEVLGKNPATTHVATRRSRPTAGYRRRDRRLRRSAAPARR